jgi:hypothetical protein
LAYLTIEINEIFGNYSFICSNDAFNSIRQTTKVNEVTKKEKKNTTVLKKTNIPLQQLKCDTFQIIEGVVHDVLRRKIAGYLYANFNIEDLLITKDYPIKANLSMNTEGYNK